MAKPLILTGRTELLATIYNPDILPSAIVCAKGHRSQPWCVHSLRDGDEDLFEKKLMGLARTNSGLSETDSSKDNELQFELHRFFDEYPEQSGVCHGCYYNHEKNSDVVQHKVRETESLAVKTTEDCA